MIGHARALDTSGLRPIRIEPHSSPLRSQARDILADRLLGLGPQYRNAAESVRAGTYANMWVEAALGGIEDALRKGPDDE